MISHDRQLCSGPASTGFRSSCGTSITSCAHLIASSLLVRLNLRHQRQYYLGHFIVRRFSSNNWLVYFKQQKWVMELRISRYHYTTYKQYYGIHHTSTSMDPPNDCFQTLRLLDKIPHVNRTQNVKTTETHMARMV